jgi:hypothetical protein
MDNQQRERRERYEKSRAEGLKLFAAIDARRRAEAQAADSSAAPLDDDEIIRREINTVDDPVARWKADADAAQAARELETRRRTRAVEAKRHEQRQHSDVVTTLRSDVDQVSANLVDGLRAVGVMGEAAAKQFDDMGHAIALLNERLALSEAKAQTAEVTVRELRTELRNALVEMSVQKSRLADLNLEIKQALFDKRVAEAAPMLHSNVN